MRKEISTDAELISRLVSMQPSPAECLVAAARIEQFAAREAEIVKVMDAVQGLSEILDRNSNKGPIPDVEMMFCWLAAQSVRAAFRNLRAKAKEAGDAAI